MTAVTADNKTSRLDAVVERLRRVWPDRGGRHQAVNALAGGLLHDGLPLADVETLVERLAVATGDEEAAKRLDAVKNTAERLQQRKAVTGWPRLGELLGEGGPAAVAEARRLLGLTVTVGDLARAKCLPAGFLRTQVGLYDLPTGGVAIPYKDASGRTVEVKQRTRLQAKDGSYSPKGQRLMAYGEERLEEATRAGYLTLVEGESDCWALWFHGEPALGLPGAETVDKTLCQGHVACVRTIYVVQETDAGGQQFVTNVRQRLAALGWRGTLKVVALSDAKDPSELHCRNPQGFTGTWKQALEQAGAVDVGTAAPGRTPPVRRVDPYRPFPVEALPEPVRS